MMGRRDSRAAMLVLGLSALLPIAGCGSTTTGISSGAPRTVAQASTSNTEAPSAPVVTDTSTVTSTAAATGPGGGTPAPATRTAAEPEFTKGTSTDEGIGAAKAVVEAHGFTVADPSQYHENQALRVIIGSRTGDQEQAFFFVNSRYIGTDAKEPSANVRVISQSDTEVTLGYSLYRPGNALCCPAGGVAKVRFQLNNGLLTTLDPIPAARSSSGTSRQ